MIWIARALRIGLIGVCLGVLSGIIPISLEQFRTGEACPNIGIIPACYVVSVAYIAMALAGVIWWRIALKLFLVGAVPVITLAFIGTATELSGTPTCPRSAGGLPLCYVSLTLGVSLLLVFVAIRWIETKCLRPVG